MKAVSLCAPYGTLIAIAERFPDLGKRIETRGRQTHYRGPLAIHQAQSLRYVGGLDGLRSTCCREPFKSALRASGIDLDQVDIDVLPRGAIVAVCEVVGCVTTDDIVLLSPFEFVRRAGRGGIKYTLTDQERAFGDYSPGRWGWLLSNIRALPEPVPCRGYQGMWELDTLTELAIKRQQVRAVQI